MKLRNKTMVVISFATMVALCAIFSFLIYTWLGDNVFPIDDIDSYYWAELYLKSYAGYAIGAFVSNMLNVILHKSKTPQRKWGYLLLSSLITAIAVSIPFFIIYQIDGWFVYWLATLGLTIFTGPGTFFVTTLFAPWDYNPCTWR